MLSPDRQSAVRQAALLGAALCCAVATPGQAQELAQDLTERPFERFVDLELNAITAFPDVFALCLEANPSALLSIDACAGSALVLSSLSAHVGSRFLRAVRLKPRQGFVGKPSWYGSELSLGPKVGLRSLSDPTSRVLCFDGLLSLEYVHWNSPSFGIGVQLEVGAVVVPGIPGVPWGALPLGRLAVSFSL